MASVSRTASFASSHGSTNPSYAGVAIGANGGNDVIYLAFGGRSTSSVTAVTGITVDGVAATQIIDQDTGNTTANIAAIFAIARNSLPDPTQTDVDIAITYDQSVLRTGGEVYVSGDASATPTHTNFEAIDGLFSTNQTLDGNVNTVLDGIVIAYAVEGATSAATPPTNAWTGATEDTDGQFAGSSTVRSTAHASGVAAATPRTVQCVVTKNGTTDIASPLLVVASFPPAAAPAGAPRSFAAVMG